MYEFYFTHLGRNRNDKQLFTHNNLKKKKKKHKSNIKMCKVNFLRFLASRPISSKKRIQNPESSFVVVVYSQLENIRKKLLLFPIWLIDPYIYFLLYRDLSFGFLGPKQNFFTKKVPKR